MFIRYLMECQIALCPLAIRVLHQRKKLISTWTTHLASKAHGSLKVHETISANTMMASSKATRFTTAAANLSLQNHFERQIMKEQILDCLAAIAIGAVFAILLAWRG